MWLYVLKYPESMREKVLTKDAVHEAYQRLSHIMVIRMYPHGFRYTYASRLPAKGFSAAPVQSWMEHSSPPTTLMAYARAIEEVEILRVWRNRV